MTAELRAWQEGERLELAKILPLETPLSISFDPSSFCNLKCKYCVQGLAEKPFKEQMLDLELFKKAAQSMTKFPRKLKSTIFGINGEPTLNPRLPEMIRYLKDLGVVQNLIVFTNGITLGSIGSALLDAGVTHIRVSLEGLSDERYLELCGVKVSYHKIIENVAAVYNDKVKRGKDCLISVKSFEQSLAHEGEREQFFRDFGGICDQISIQSIVPIRSEVDYSGQECSYDKNLLQQDVVRIDVCAQPFYALYVHASGDVLPCCIDLGHLIVGNIRENGLDEIWNGSKLRRVREEQLARRRYDNNACRDCCYPSNGMQIKDRIDSVAETLYQKMFQ